jgi:hypothetical protein
MSIIYLLAFFIAVLIFAAITSKLNRKTKCTHDWEEQGRGVIKCRKCNKSVHLQNGYDNEHMAA